ncbi:hypothetical protein G205_08743 [Arthrobacter nitrophenolicus]|uniref:Uncharacterized protein n=1 Tax=Arthrobacter nitrophenolicus TaxID=683150 RepID=L8TT69_9MICC|nr:hypothetical protein G205_08743 [Arthrobacter nitrophenolicus]
MFTAQSLVTAPWAPCCSWKDEVTMLLPLTSTGPRMYLMAGVVSVAGSQVTSGLAGSERSCSSWAGLSQSRDSNCR